MARIACLHAHYSNIQYIQNAFATKDVEFIHYVDPGLLIRMGTDASFNLKSVHDKVKDQIEWLASTQVDAILITCTNYIALLSDVRLDTSIPIIKIDEPFFHTLCNITGPQVLLFTNPSTVEGTMRRLTEFTAAHAYPAFHFDADVIENTFELLMQGSKDQYLHEISTYMKVLIASEPQKMVSVAQLSMVEAAREVEREMGIDIGNPLDPLVKYIQSKYSQKT